MSKYTECPAWDEVPTRKGMLANREKFRFYFDDSMTGDFLEIPKGYLINGASRPQGLARIMDKFNFDPHDPRWVSACGGHDALVGEHDAKLQIRNDETGFARFVDWWEALRWFNKMLKVTQENVPQCPPLHRRAFILSVYLWGIKKTLMGEMK